MTEKSFDINSPTQGYPVREVPAGEDANALAGTRSEEPEKKPDESETIFPLRFDRNYDKDFRPREIIEAQQTPKDSSVPAPANTGQSSLTSVTGLEDVSAEDEESMSAPATAEKDS